jgi:hypothetical protein
MTMYVFTQIRDLNAIYQVHCRFLMQANLSQLECIIH